MCLLVPKGLFMFPEPLDQLAGTIDIWWIIHDGGLMILLPFLLRYPRIVSGSSFKVIIHFTGRTGCGDSVKLEFLQLLKFRIIVCPHFVC